MDSVKEVDKVNYDGDEYIETYTWTYIYDNNANLLEETSYGGTYDYLLEKFEYDKNGNTLSRIYYMDNKPYNENYWSGYKLFYNPNA